MNEEGSETVDQGNEAVEQEARSLGWLSKDEFKGKEEHWVGAAEFLERGRGVLPIMHATNERLKGDNARLQAQIASLNATTQANAAALAALEESREAEVAAAREEERKRVRAELAAASREGDHDRVAELTEELVDLGKPATDDKGGDKGGDKPAVPRPSAEVVAWFQEHPEYSREPRRLALGNVITAELRAQGETLTGAAFLDKVNAEVEKVLGKAGARAAHGKVESSNGGSGRSGGGSTVTKTYNDLPKEAKDACDRMNSRLVGAGKAHKDVASWRAAYTKKFFEQEGA